MWPGNERKIDLVENIEKDENNISSQKILVLEFKEHFD